MTKRHLEPIVWLLFSGGGVVASVFLPILDRALRAGHSAGLGPT